MRAKNLQLNKVYWGDARAFLPLIQNDSVACSVWSPPYFVGKTYESHLKSFAEWKTLLREVIHLHFPITLPGGFLVVNIADILCFKDTQMPRIQAENLTHRKSKVSREDINRARRKHPNYSRYQLAELLGCSEQTIDRRLNGNNIRGGKYNTQTRVKEVGGMLEEWALEAGFYLYDRRIWAKDPAWQNSEWHTTSYRAVDEFEYLYFFWKPGATVIDRKRLTPEEWSSWGSRGVWQIRSVRSNDDHEAKFPPELPRRVIQMLTAPGDVVLDCFVGSGTTGVVALEMGRRFIGIELDRTYAAGAQKKIERTSSATGTVAQDQRRYPEPAMLPFAATAGN